ncbi:MAG: acyl-CoA dehydratase activase [Clostridium sp.]|nr:acyl-CoA dehydratase activase [Clostridium sp.]
MRQLGIDIGTSCIRLVLLSEGAIRQKWGKVHHGRLLPTLSEGLAALHLTADPLLAAVTGSNAGILLSCFSPIGQIEEIPAVAAAIHSEIPEASCAIDIGGQGARFITDLHCQVPRFNTNEHCAGGTGSFFEDQMSRLGMEIGDYSETVRRARQIPRLSGRCAVFAKTDIIHRQQEGLSVPDILLGLCYAMIRNYKAVIVRDLPIQAPVVFTGGVTQNEGAVRAVRDVFSLPEDALIIPDNAVFMTALGCALRAETMIRPADLLHGVEAGHDAHVPHKLPVLRLTPGTYLHDPPATGRIPAGGCALGIDIGSTSTDLVLTGADGSLIDFQYLRTAGDPEGAVRRGLDSIRKRFGNPDFLAVGVTGSGRERIGRMIFADAVRDEITAQAKAASFRMPEVDTVFEIGGQDSKYICLKSGEVADFQMNRICAAGTGSFVEEQAARMDIPIEAFGPLALTSSAPSELGERCTVFIETAIDSALAEGARQEDIAAGLCHAVVRNYLHKVVGGKPVGRHIVLQGGVAYNPGIVAAFQTVCGDRLTVSPYFSISGAFGAALLALETNPSGKSSFRGLDTPPGQMEPAAISEEVANNIRFYRKSREAFFKNYDGTVDPSKKTVGIPYALMMHKFFPLAHAFFKTLGYNVILSDPTSEDTIRLSQQTAQGETCYPVKLIYGHMMQLIQKKVDYIFMPNVHTVKHPKSRVAANYGCVYMQSAPTSIGQILKLEERGIGLLAPVFDLDMGKEAMASAMIGVGKQLGKSKPACLAALMAGSAAVREYDAAAERMGQELLEGLQPDDKVLVMITRNYGISDPVLNMGIPELLIRRGHKVINLEHLPGHDIDVAIDHSNLYWPFGQHILSGAKIIAHHPNLYAVYLTNHGCGPDTMLSHMFREEMGEKPYLQIEVDEHYSSVGVITRIEAFLNSLSHREARRLPESFDIRDVHFSRQHIAQLPGGNDDSPLYVPDLGLYSNYLCRYLQQAYGLRAEALPALSRTALAAGRAETTSKEYLPFTALLGSILLHLKHGYKEHSVPGAYLVPSTRGAEADGQYARAIRAILNRCGYEDNGIVSPILESMPAEIKAPALLLRAVAAADLVGLLPPDMRANISFQSIPDEEGLLSLASLAGRISRPGKRLAAVGTPMCLASLNEGVLDRLESEGNHILRAPLAEYLLFLWQEEKDVREKCAGFLEHHTSLFREISRRAGRGGSFSPDPEQLHREADRVIGRVSGGGIRYRFAKAMEMSLSCDAVLNLAPRYENAAMVMEMRGIRNSVKAPLYTLYYDGDWDESAWARLRSFLFYC